MKGTKDVWRRRIGSYRIKYEIQTSRNYQRLFFGTSDFTDLLTLLEYADPETIKNARDIIYRTL